MHYSWAIDVRIHGSSICPWNPYFCRFIVTLAWVLGQLLALLLTYSFTGQAQISEACRARDVDIC
jgi:hypothetical protein